MPHIHELIDYTVAALIVHKNKVLLIHHKKMNIWLPIGGHVELNENPEEALYREILEETGLTMDDYEVIGTRPDFYDENTLPLLHPRFLDIHKVNATHQHIGMMYIVQALTERMTLSDEHYAFGWFTKTQLESLDPPIRPGIKFYCEAAIDEVAETEELDKSIKEFQKLFTRD